MNGSKLLADVEDAARCVARLDARVAASPLREAWDVRAAAKAAIVLAAVDGRQVREADLVGMMTGAMLPVASSYLGAGVALAWWMRSVGRSALSDATALLVGRRPTGTRRAQEDQAEWDGEDAMSRSARKALGNVMRRSGDVDDDVWAEGGRAAALAAMRRAGDGLVDIAKGLKDALSIDRDPDRPERVHELAAIVARQAEARFARDTECLDREMVERRRELLDDMLSSLDWEAPRGLGEAHMAVADRLVETGATTRRLGILTGATKRIAVERRGDGRAASGFLRTLAREAREGEALLAALEAVVVRWARDPALAVDRRSSLPDVLWSILVLPVVDVDWIASACSLDQRVVQKFVKRLHDAGAIEPWAGRMTEGMRRRSAQVVLWVPSRFAEDLARRESRAAPVRPTRPVFSRTLSMASEVDRGVRPAPMSEVFVRFDRELVEIGEAFGSLWAKSPL